MFGRLTDLAIVRGCVVVGLGVVGLCVTKQFEDVVCGGDELPFAIDRAEAAAGEASDAAVVFGLSEDGLDRRASFLVEPSPAWCGEFGDH